MADLKAKARAAYVMAHGEPLDNDARVHLSGSIDELAFSAIQKAVNNDPYHPKVYWVDCGPRTLSGIEVPGGRYSYDNPDCIYRILPIAGDGRYVVRGRRFAPGPSDVTFSLIRNPNSQRTISVLTGGDLEIEADGSYEVTIDGDPAGGRGNHIRSNAHARQLLVRNSLGDWNAETPDALTVELLDDPSPHPEPSLDQIASWAEDNLMQSIVDYGIGALGIKTMRQPVNSLADPEQSSRLGTLVTQASSFGHFSVAADLAMIITLKPGAATYFVVPVTNPWMITTDPGYYPLSLNNTQALSNPDGTYTLVLSALDGGAYNWLDTGGMISGTLMLRWQNLPPSPSPGDEPGVSVEIVPLLDLRQVLPPGTRFVTQAERHELNARRLVGYQRRFED